MTDDVGMVETLALSGLSLGEDERGGLDSGCGSFSFEEAESIVLRWESGGGEQMVWEVSSEAAEAYLKAVDRLQALASAMEGSDSDRARKALKIAAQRLKNEFKHLLAIHTECVDPSWLPESFSAPSFSSNPEVGEEDGNSEEGVSAPQSMREQLFILDLLPPATVADLKEIASRLVAMGHARDCIDSYILVRKGVFEDSMFLLGVEKVAADEIQRMQWQVLEPRMKKFIKGMNVSVRVLFASERVLCDDVFEGNLEVSDTCFGELANDAAFQVLGAFKACAEGPSEPERLFRLLDMYEMLKDLHPQIEGIFQGQACDQVYREADEVLGLLGAAVRKNFMELRNAIERDPARASVLNGALHPLTRYVMNYLGLLSEYLDTLHELYGREEDVLGDDSNTTSEGEGGEDEGGGQKSALQETIMLILDALLKKLDETSKLYKDQALGCVFLMNNIHYIVQKAKASDLQHVIGPSWLRRQSSLVRFHSLNYQRLGWGNLFSFLKDEGIRGHNYTVSRDVLKERFRNFNATFEEIHRTQSGWIVPEVKLREDLRLFISDKLVPAYRSFLGRYKEYFEGVRHPERYLKYTVEDIEDHIGTLFEGTTGSMSRNAGAMSRRRSFQG